MHNKFINQAVIFYKGTHIGMLFKVFPFITGCCYNISMDKNRSYISIFWFWFCLYFPNVCFIKPFI